MLLKTILNHVYKQPGFVISKTIFDSSDSTSPRLNVLIRPRRGSRPRCSGCGSQGPGYDTQGERAFEFIPLWGIAVFFLYTMRRVDCRGCGVKIEKVPWADGKCELTVAYSWFLAKWAKRLSWSEVATTFHTSWDKVFRAVEKAVIWGLKHRDLSDIGAIGIDEILWQRSYKFLTVVYQIDTKRKRLIWIGKNRKAITLMRFFHWFGPERTRALRFICSDMWRGYLKVIAYYAEKGTLSAVHILDRFHLAKNINKAINKVRNQEAKALKEKGNEVLKNSRWAVLKRPENLTVRQNEKLKDIEKANTKTFRAYLLKEDLQNFWNYSSPTWAGKFLDQWCKRVMKSKIEPMKKIVKSFRKHKPLILNYFRAKGRVSLGATEGQNNPLKMTIRKAFGFRTYKATEIALYHAMGDLPEPKTTHRFY